VICSLCRNGNVTAIEFWGIVQPDQAQVVP
jgi:hypothetical protein